jgi:hypothetical protein
MALAVEFLPVGDSDGDAKASLSTGLLAQLPLVLAKQPIS